jgi:hypothetical protein
MKFIHFARDRHYGPGELPLVAAQLMQARTSNPLPPDARKLLVAYREQQRRGWK